MAKYRITGIQMALLILGFLFGSAGILNPAAGARQNAWLAFTLGWAGGLVLLGIYIMIYRLHPSKTLVGILKDTFGAVIGSILMVLYIWYFIHLAALVLRNFGEFMSTIIHPDTPMVFLMASLAAVCTYTLRKGVEVMGRTGEVFVPLLPVAVAFIFFAVMGQFDPEHFLPVLGGGWAPVVSAAFSIVTFPFGETVVFLMVFTFLNKDRSLSISAYSGAFIAGFLLLSVLLRDTMALGADVIDRATFPAEVTAKLIPYFNIYPLIMVNLLIGGGAKVTICIYAAAAGTAELAGVSDYKTLVLPITALAVIIAVWLYESVVEMFEFASDIWPYYSIPFQILIPGLILLISLVKKRHKKGSLAV